MKYLFSFFTLILIFSCQTPADVVSDRVEIKTILLKQQKAWSQNNIEEFMQGYWKSDSLKFYSGAQLNMGWENTLKNYKTRYPSKAHSGVLNFNLVDISKINQDAYWVMGEYHLKREVGDAKGTFMIIFKRINGEWKIVADSSC
mgnify:CR=1 FL=1